MDGTYTELKAAEILKTAQRLAQRIEERFPGAGLSKVAATVVEFAGAAGPQSAALAEPNRPIRLSVAAVLTAGAAGLMFLIASTHPSTRFDVDVIPIVQAIESTMNIAILVGIGLVALTQLESRWKRRRALAALHTLRSLAHVIDMHQLTKDPNSASDGYAERTKSSPTRPLNGAQLERYLDYCSELLSLIGKLAALYAQCLHDEIVNQTVNEIEMLTTNLARKIWQKIAILAESASRPVSRVL
jgi:hypothetical protein